MIDNILPVIAVVVVILIVLPHLRSAERRRNVVDPMRVSEELRKSSQLERLEETQTYPHDSPGRIHKRADIIAERKMRQRFCRTEHENELLQRWLVEGKIEMSDQEFLEWLPNQSPDTWHAIVRNWNWDYGSAPLLQIISQPQCDLGTAFRIFFVDAQNWPDVLDYSQWQNASYQDAWYTCALIAKRWRENSFHNKDFWLEGERGPYESWTNGFRKKEKALVDQGKYPSFIVPDYVYAYQGNRDCISDFTWMEGCLMHSFDSWKRQNGYSQQDG